MDEYRTPPEVLCDLFFARVLPTPAQSAATEADIVANPPFDGFRLEDDMGWWFDEHNDFAKDFSQ